jgi:hypothetical protein
MYGPEALLGNIDYQSSQTAFHTCMSVAAIAGPIKLAACPFAHCAPIAFHIDGHFSFGSTWLVSSRLEPSG